MFRFTIRDVLWLTVVAACLAAWWFDRVRLSSENNTLKNEQAKLRMAAQSAPPAQTDSGANHTLTNIDLERLCQHWYRSVEEEQPPNINQIYRPKTLKDIPPARFRMQFIFQRNGDCQWYYLSPDDNHHFKPGRWSVDPTDKSLLRITMDDRTAIYRMTELTNDVMRLTALTSTP